jgi:signal transduction histidine kinase
MLLFSPASKPSLSWLKPRRLPKYSLLLDLCIGAGLMAYLVTATAVTGNEGWVWEIARDVLRGIAISLRRVWTIPATMIVLVAAGYNELTVWPYPLGVAVMLYTIAASDYPKWLAWAAAAVAVFFLLLPWPSEVELSADLAFYLVPEVLLFTVAPVAFGLYARERQRLIAVLQAREADAARQAKLEAERVRADERNRLANEIHDVVAHSVSLMIVHTGALKLAATDERTREVADLVRTSGHVALQEMREMVSVLRTEDNAPLGPVPTLDNLEPLIEESRSAGFYVDFQTSGVPRKVSGSVERTAFRVVQESLTNILKHAPGAAAQVDLTWRLSRLDITVRNDPPQRPPMDLPQSGHGLRSLRERVSLLSGDFQAGPTNEGGWRVYASLPIGGG